MIDGSADRRRLGSSDVAIGRLGLGAAQLGNLYRPMTDEDATAIVDLAQALGIDYIDTSPHYGLGLSERRVGAALRRHKDASDVVVSTKVGRVLEPRHGEGDHGDDMANQFAVPADWERRWDFSAAGVRRSLADSRERMGRERIDIAFLHDPDDFMDQALGEALPELVARRDAGELGAIGAGMNSADKLQRIIETGLVDVVLLAGRYTLLEQGALDGMLDAAVATRTSVIVGGVFNSGLLARSEVADGARHNYAPAPAALLDRARRLATVCAEHGTPLPAAAVQFPLAHPAVANVLVGASSVAELAEDHAAFTFPIPPALWESLRSEGLLPADAPTPGFAGRVA